MSHRPNASLGASTAFGTAYASSRPRAAGLHLTPSTPDPGTDHQNALPSPSKDRPHIQYGAGRGAGPGSMGSEGKGSGVAVAVSGLAFETSYTNAYTTPIAPLSTSLSALAAAEPSSRSPPPPYSSPDLGFFPPGPRGQWSLSLPSPRDGKPGHHRGFLRDTGLFAGAEGNGRRPSWALRRVLVLLACAAAGYAAIAWLRGGKDWGISTLVAESVVDPPAMSVLRDKLKVSETAQEAAKEALVAATEELGRLGAEVKAEAGAAVGAVKGAAEEGSWAVKKKSEAFKAKAWKAARLAAAKAKKLIALLPDQGLSRRFKYGANFQPDSRAGHKGDKEGDNTNVLRVTAPDPTEFFREGRRKYLTEKDYWRKFTWEAPPPHESLKVWEDKLTKDETDLRESIWHMRAKMETGHNIGLAARHRHTGYPIFPQHHYLASDAGLVSIADLADLSFGSSTKWSDLLAEEAAAADGLRPQCPADGSAWMREYAILHREIMADAESGDSPGRFITYICESGTNCGGLGDRLLGMTSAFLFGLVTGRAFHAEWQAPFPLDVVFDSPYIDWSYSTFTAPHSPVFGDPQLAEQARELDIIHFNGPETDRYFGTRPWDAPLGKSLTRGLETRDLAFASPWIKFFTNRGLIYRSFSYKSVSKRLSDLGLKPHSAFSCILSYLFVPKPAARDLILSYTSLLSLPSIFAVGIQVRTGDRSMKDRKYDRQNTIELHKDFFRCADELAETYAQPGQKLVYYLVTDSAHLREDAVAKLGEKVIISGLGIQHVHQKSGHTDGVFNAVIEEWILAKTDYRVITQDSGFGKLASFAAAKPSTTVSLFPKNNLDVVGLESGARTKVNCRLDSAFTSFADLASEWSLG